MGIQSTYASYCQENDISEEHKEKLRHGFDERWNKGNLEAMFAWCGTDFVHFRPPFSAIESLEARKPDIEKTFKTFSNAQLIYPH